ncbi:hypothetical protein D1007_18804 [Hordeum vulgare]|nr:hypothetical protein D1007_18804 [Hordeum vulgare]
MAGTSPYACAHAVATTTASHDMLGLSAAGDVVVSELDMTDVKGEVKEEVLEEHPVAVFHSGLVGQRWIWSCTTMNMSDTVGVGSWCPTSPQSPEHELPPSGEVVQARSSYEGPSSHLWTPSAYIDLAGDEDDNGGT